MAFVVLEFGHVYSLNPMDSSLNFLITGASRGIGLELATQLLKAGHHVWAVARKIELKDLKAQFPKTLKTFSVDVSSEKSVRALLKELGSAQLDVLINGAGVLLDGDSDFKDVSIANIEESFRINTLGPIQVTQLLLPLLERSKHPKVINISSLMGSIEDNRGGYSYAYRISKTALNMFTKNLAIEFPQMISVVLHPGWVKTDMGGSNAPTSPQESAQGMIRVIQGLKSEDSGSFIDFEGEKLPW